MKLQIPPDYNTKLLVAFAGGTGPDAYRIQGIYGRNMAYHGALLDLSSYLDRDKTAKADFEGMAKASQQAATYNGKIIGMPFGGTLIITIYNEDIVRKNGLKQPAD
ncbi:MAG: extracellular solute-binding protein, partial [Chloroflexi bacterium]|nr:extracellular solute-binding protein [Chloroflexota bacterium]